MRRLRVLQIGSGWFPVEIGGLERYFRELNEQLSRLDTETRMVVVSRVPQGDLPGDATVAASPDHSFGRRVRHLRSTVRKLVDSFRPDLVAGHFSPYFLAIRDILGPLPQVVHFHGPWSLESQVAGGSRLSGWAKLQVERRAYRNCTGYVTLSSAFQTLLVSTYGVDRERSTVIPGGIPETAMSPLGSRAAARKSLGWKDSERVVLAVRRLTPRTGVEDLVEAVEGLEGLRVVIVGDGELRGTLESRSDRTGHVHVVGRVEEAQLKAMYEAADVSVLPSRELEGFGISVIESLARGTPVLATPVGGMPEILQGLHRNLVLSGVGAAPLRQALTQYAAGALDLPTREDCQAHVRKNYLWGSIAPRIERFYRETAGFD